MGHSTPSITCDNSAPTATSDASESTIHGRFGCGNAKEVASFRANFNLSKASWASCVHSLPHRRWVHFLHRSHSRACWRAVTVGNIPCSRRSVPWTPSLTEIFCVLGLYSVEVLCCVTDNWRESEVCVCDQYSKLWCLRPTLAGVSRNTMTPAVPTEVISPHQGSLPAAPQRSVRKPSRHLCGVILPTTWTRLNSDYC